MIDQRGPARTVQRPASTEAVIIRTVIGKNTAASRYPDAPATSTRYSAVKKKIANVAKYVQNAATFAVVNCGTRRKRRSSTGYGGPPLPPARTPRPEPRSAHSKTITVAEPNPADSASMTANTNVASAPAPSSVPAVSTRRRGGVALSGKMTAATTRAANPKTRLNQKMPRQFQAPTITPPMTGPAASANPDVAAHTPIARLLALASGYRCRSIDSVPGSLAAAPSPITARPAMSVWTFGASAHRTEPAQKTPAPASMTFLRPSSSPIIPQASMMLAKVRA